MKNYLQPGDILTLTAPAGGATSGVATLIGNLVVIPSATVAAGVAVQCALVGVYSSQLKAAGAAWTAGQVLYFDSADLTFKTAASATARRAAIAAADAIAGATIGTVKLVNIGAAVNVA